MKITITIEIETMKKNPAEEVASQPQPQQERTQATLNDFTQRSGSSRKGVPCYRDGRKVHHCSNCQAPHRRITASGFCLEDGCEEVGVIV